MEVYIGKEITCKIKWQNQFFLSNKFVSKVLQTNRQYITLL